MGVAPPTGRSFSRQEQQVFIPIGFPGRQSPHASIHHIAILRGFTMPTAKFLCIPIPTDEAAFHIRAADALTTHYNTDSATLIRVPSRTHDPLLSRFHISFPGTDIIIYSIELRRDSESHPRLFASLSRGPFPSERSPDKPP